MAHQTGSSPPSTLVDTNQNFFQLACIQLIYSLPTFFVASQLANKHGAGTALLSFIVANLILWLMSLATVSMALKARKNAIENMADYIGKFGSILGALALIVAFVLTFSIQINTTTQGFTDLVTNYSPNTYHSLLIGIVLGLLTALLAIWGIKLIKWFSTLLLPLSLLYTAILLTASPKNVPFHGTWGISMGAVAIGISWYLPGIINLPTFFRHAKNRGNAYLALSLIFGINTLIQYLCIKIDIRSTLEYYSLMPIGPKQLNTILLVVFSLLTLVCLNLVNVYFASATWESILPRVGGRKERFIIGIIGTLIFLATRDERLMYQILTFIEGTIASLVIILLITFLVKIVVSHRIRKYEFLFSILCWFCGAATVLFVLLRADDGDTIAFFAGMGMTLVIATLLLYLEESVWSLKELIKYERKKS